MIKLILNIFFGIIFIVAAIVIYKTSFNKTENLTEKSVLEGSNHRNMTDYSKFDRAEINAFIFHPRSGASVSKDNISEFLIPVDNNVKIGAMFCEADKSSPTILFFHGNGEIVSDYVDLCPLYTRMNINFLAVDYRGYGKSTGHPTVSSMMNDCHSIFNYIKKWLKDNNYNDQLIIMGRSLGSASACELALKYEDEIDGLIIESGFAYTIPLLKLLGINTDALGLKEDDGFNNIDKIKMFKKPTLIIHAEKDHIIPFSDGEALYNSSKAPYKKFVRIPQANHNSIFIYGIEPYMKAVKELIDNIKK